MSKKIWISLVAIILLVSSGGFFYWKTQEDKGSPKDYSIEKSEEEKIIVNERAGLKIKVPDGWIEEKIEEMEGSIIFYSPYTESKSEGITPPLKKGCLIEVAVIYKNMNFDDVIEEIKEIHIGLGIKSEKFEFKEINNHRVLENKFDSMYLGRCTAIYFSEKNKLYSFSAYSSPEEEKECLEEFYKLLEKISIN